MSDTPDDPAAEAFARYSDPNMDATDATAAPEPVDSASAGPPAPVDPTPQSSAKVPVASEAPEEAPPKTPVKGEQTVPPAEPGSASSVEVVVQQAPTPGAVKFFDTVQGVGSQVSGLAPDDISDGMYELSSRCSAGMKDNFTIFKTHALDLAVTACSDAPEGQVRPQLGETAEATAHRLCRSLRHSIRHSIRTAKRFPAA